MSTLREEPVPLRDGSTTLDPRLDRILDFDEKSRAYPIRALIEQEQPRTKWWGHTAVLDQGSEGACVGFAWSHELNANPVEVQGITDEFALRIYRRAQQIDEWPGEQYSGTSVLAGAKAVAELGYLDEYRWAFGIEDVILTLSWHGPVVLGINWYYGMYRPDANQYIYPTGQIAGGHAIMAIAYDHENQEVWLLNSWGRGYGWDGLCRIKVADLAKLLQENGEACVPVVRGEGPQPEPQPEPEPEVVEPEIEPEVVIEPEPVPEPEPEVIEPEFIDDGPANDDDDDGYDEYDEDDQNGTWRFPNWRGRVR